MTSHDTIPSPQPPDATDATLGICGEHESSGSQADSHETNKRQTQNDSEATADETAASHAGKQDAGNIPPVPVAEPPAGDPRARARDVTNRLLRECRWAGQAEVTRDELIAASKGQFKSQTERQQWVYGELDRMYPPVRACTEVSDLNRNLPDGGGAAASDSGAIQGLSDLPAGWPELPSNASLSTEIGWVQANRLRVVDERPGRATVVRLEQALGPAPSWAALGWLETSIRSYAKFVDVAAKVSGGQEDEGAVMRRERKSIEEVRALMQEMMDAEGSCPHCGRPH